MCVLLLHVPFPERLRVVKCALASQKAQSRLRSHASAHFQAEHYTCMQLDNCETWRLLGAQSSTAARAGCHPRVLVA